MSEQEEAVTQQGDQTVGDTPTGVDGQGSKGEETAPKRGGPSRENAAFRVQKKLLERLETLEEKLDSLTTTPQQQAAETSTPSDLSNFWANPQNYLDQYFEEKITQSEVKQQKRQALDWILSQDGVIETAEDEEAIAELMNETGLSDLAQIYPMKAAKAAISLFLAEKGLSEGNETSAEAQAAGVRGSQPVKYGGAKVWSREEIAALPPDKVNEHINDIMEAYKTGRIK